MLKLNLPSKNPIVILFLVVGVFALAAAPSYYFYNKYQKSQQFLKNPTEAARAEVKTLVERVSKHIDLPQEEPTVATVSDNNKLKDQAFFAKAQNGDKVLIYTQARKAILYRVATDKIIEASTVNIGGVVPASTAQTNRPAKLAIYNGTKTAGLAGLVEKQLKEKISSIEEVIKDNAKNDYEKSVVVLLSKDKEQEARTIAQVLGAQVSNLPEGEIKPEADILIILGSDYTKK